VVKQYGLSKGQTAIERETTVSYLTLRLKVICGQLICQVAWYVSLSSVGLLSYRWRIDITITEGSLRAAAYSMSSFYYSLKYKKHSK
jgi:hypothetical protein